MQNKNINYIKIVRQREEDQDEIFIVSSQSSPWQYQTTMACVIYFFQFTVNAMSVVTWRTVLVLHCQWEDLKEQ